MARAWVVLGVVCFAAGVRADETRSPVVAAVSPAPAASVAPTSATASTTVAAPNRDWHIGLNLRTDFGARFYRADLGVRVGRWDSILVVDPFGAVNGDYDFDGIERFALNRSWSVFTGGRLTIVPIGREHQLSEKYLVGMSGIMPSFGLSGWRLHAGVELAVHVASHGGGLPTQWVCVDSPNCRKDHFVFGLFARFEHVSAF